MIYRSNYQNSDMIKALALHLLNYCHGISQRTLVVKRLAAHYFGPWSPLRWQSQSARATCASASDTFDRMTGRIGYIDRVSCCSAFSHGHLDCCLSRRIYRSPRSYRGAVSGLCASSYAGGGFRSI